MVAPLYCMLSTTRTFSLLIFWAVSHMMFIFLKIRCRKSVVDRLLMWPLFGMLLFWNFTFIPIVLVLMLFLAFSIFQLPDNHYFYNQTRCYILQITHQSLTCFLYIVFFTLFFKCFNIWKVHFKTLIIVGCCSPTWWYECQVCWQLQQELCHSITVELSVLWHSCRPVVNIAKSCSE